MTSAISHDSTAHRSLCDRTSALAISTLAISTLAIFTLAATAVAQTAPPTSQVRQGEVSGRPPLSPLVRENPRLFDLSFGVTIFTELPPTDASLRGVIDVNDAPIVLPFILRSTWSSVDITSLSGRMFLDGREDAGAPQRARVETDQPFGMAFAILTTPRFRGQTLRWEIGYRVQTWASRIDDRAAGNVAWPQEWPPECADALRPQTLIDSEHPIFAGFVQRFSGGAVRDVPPYFAAKDLIRGAIANFRVTDPPTVRREGGGVVGMELSLASVAADLGHGTPHDLVAICVAVLRAAGIPARPVIGIDRDPVESSGSAMITWGEFFLPEAGWVPFDPMRMRGANIARLNVRDAWPGLGTMRNLNRRIPLAFTFHPTSSVIAHEWPAVWGWDPRPSRTPSSTRQIVSINTNNRGAGQPDPR